MCRGGGIRQTSQLIHSGNGVPDFAAVTIIKVRL